MFDRTKIDFQSLEKRENRFSVKDFYHLNSKIPEYNNPDLDILAGKIVEARKNGKPVIWMMGAHVIRRGNSRFIIDLMEKRIITHVATNMACAIHDFEMALIGETCEDVEFYIQDGKFGNWIETGVNINQAAKTAYALKIGLGEAIGRVIAAGLVECSFSIFAAAYNLEIPITVHKGIGYDITDQHPLADFAALGWTSGQDFLIFADAISELEDGGVFLNIGTQVMGPEVYLKALSMARNVASQEGREIRHFITAVFDIVDLGDFRKEDDVENPNYYFRPKKTILIRTVKDGGESFYIRGDLGVTVPNLYKRITALMKGDFK